MLTLSDLNLKLEMYLHQIFIIALYTGTIVYAPYHMFIRIINANSNTNDIKHCSSV